MSCSQMRPHQLQVLLLLSVCCLGCCQAQSGICLLKLRLAGLLGRPDQRQRCCSRIPAPHIHVSTHLPLHPNSAAHSCSHLLLFYSAI